MPTDETDEQKRRRILFVLMGVQRRVAQLANDVLDGTVEDVDYHLNEEGIELKWHYEARA